MTDSTKQGLEPLPSSFKSRAELLNHVKAISPWASSTEPSPHLGGREAGAQKLSESKPKQYGRTRNFLDGDVTRLSPYIRHGIISLAEARDTALSKVSHPKECEKFIQELAWRDFWQRIYAAHPDWLWEDIEDYKAGWAPTDYADELPEDIRQGQTGVASIDYFTKQLTTTGYLHNHARMYLAAYVVHWRRVRWQAGARWFLHHLLDGDPASNNLSWQWIASTFSQKPYFFNLENIQKYADDHVDTRPETNRVFDASYDELAEQLFPNRSQP